MHANAISLNSVRVNVNLSPTGILKLHQDLNFWQTVTCIDTFTGHDLYFIISAQIKYFYPWDI
jgi:hypothetical protein